MVIKLSFRILLIYLFTLSITALAQIGIGTQTPEASSKLDIFSSSKGFLPPRMTTNQRNAINGGVFAEGLVIYNTDDKCLNFYNGTDWVNPCEPMIAPPPNLPGNIILTGGQKAYIASVYDENYLPYVTATSVADTGSLSPDGISETLVDIQGVITTTNGLTVSIPYTVTTASVNLPAYSQTKTVISDHIQGSNPTSNIGGGTAVDVIFSYDAITLPVGSGNILATIKAVDNDLNAVKLDINKGIGTNLGILLAEFTIATDNTGTIDTIQLKDIPGIPDRRFGETTTQGNPGVEGLYHNNIYLPVATTNGRIWLNNNLGANYSDISHPNFNLVAQAQTVTDYNAYGSLYAWGRFSDGHELVNYTNATSGSSLNPYTGSANASTNQPFAGGASYGDWQSPQNPLLWQGSNGINNPCPDNFRLPTRDEFIEFYSEYSISNTAGLSNSILKFSNNGYRNVTNVGLPVNDVGSSMYLWTSTTSPTSEFGASTESSIRFIGTTEQVSRRAHAFPVRCIQHIEAPTPIPSNLTLSGNKVSYIASIDDQDYLPYTSPSTPANHQNSGDGTNDDTHIDIQGILSTTGQTISIPYTVSGTVNYDAYSYTVTVHDSLTQDGQGRQVNFSYPAGTASNNNGVITMTVKAIDQPLLLKKLDLTNGLGDGTSINGHINTNVFGILIAEVPILINDANDTNYVQLRNISAIPDRRFGETSVQGSVSGQHHNNLYLPITAADGKTWLNNNLGANYSDLNHPNVNIAQNATSTTDINAYGSYFQWGRFSDGHELCNITSSNQITTNSVNGVNITHSTSNTPGHNQYIDPSTIPSTDWRTSTSYDLWHSPSFENNPCPFGFKIPSLEEFENLYEKEDVANSIQFAEGQMGIPSPGSRTSLEILSTAGASGWYWTSNNGSHSRTGVGIEFNYSGSGKHVSTAQPRRTAMSVRCIQHIETPTSIPTNMTLEGNRVSYIASINDNDYLPYTAPTGPANQQSSGDGTLDDQLIDIQGVISTTGQTVSIPFKVTGSVSYDAYSYTVAVHDSLTQNGNGGHVNFSYPGGSANSNGSITMTIKAIGGPIDLKKLDLNNGLGNGTSIEGHINTNVYGVLVAEVPILINDANDTNYIQLRNTTGIPDRRFGEETVQGDPGVSGQYHNNLYLPVVAADGKTWLNNNLGAEYSRLNNYNGTPNSNFNPASQATSNTDTKAFGSLYQWGRYSDGHELMSYTNSTTANRFNSNTTDVNSSTDTPNHNLFITEPSSPLDWRDPHNDNLWNGETGINNPCPNGYRLPTDNEINTLISSENISDNNSGASSALAFSSPGQLYSLNGSGVNTGSRGYYWTSTVNGIHARNRNLLPGGSTANFSERASAFSVRCIQQVSGPISIPTNMTITGNKISYIVSTFDEDYAPFVTATTPAKLGSKIADGSNETNAIDVSGVLTTEGRTIAIPYTVTGTVDFDSYSYTVSVHDSLTEDGIGRDVNFAYTGETASTDGTILMTIKSIGGNLNLKKLDINNGIGDGTSIEGHLNSNVYGVLVAEVPIIINDANDTNYIQLRSIAGIPDRNFGEISTQGITNQEGEYHNNIYLPITAADGNIWLNNYLGAGYSNLNYSQFDPAKQATTYDDYHAYGSLYQWGRKSDGHELIIWNNASSGTRQNESTTANSNNPVDNKFIIESSSPFDWRVTQESNLWQGPFGTNNPCPDGFRPPTLSELSGVISDEGITQRANSVNGILKFAASGHRQNSNGTTIFSPSTEANIWTNTIDGTNTRSVQIGVTLVSPSTKGRANGFSVRCIMHVNTTSPIPSSMTLSGNKVSYVASIHDNDYLPYSAPTGPAKLGSKIADGSMTENVIDVQGTLTTTGQSISIPYSSTGTPAYEGYDYIISVHDSLTEDGIGRQVHFSYPGGTATNGSGSITMTIKSIGGDLNLKKLDLNNGLGNGTSIEGHLNSNVYGVLVAEVPILINDANDVNYVQLRNTAGIPDRRFGETTTQGNPPVSGQYHNNLYLPMVAEDGKIWLNNNLGANYADLTHSQFNPAQRAQAKNGNQPHQDLDAYGSLYQWGRFSDGHELIDYSSSIVGVGINDTTHQNALTDTPMHNLFIREEATPFNWRLTNNDALWQGEFSTNNPCPNGFRLPTQAEFSSLVSAANILTNVTAGQSELRLSAGGNRPYNGGVVSNEGTYGIYWTSTIDGPSNLQAQSQYFLSSASPQVINYRSYGFSVRCIQQVNGPVTIPANMTLDGNRAAYIASAFDEDYTPYPAITGPALLGSKVADGSNETNSIDLQGVLTTSGQTISIPFTATGSVNYDPYSYTVSVHDSLTEDGIGRDVNFSYPGGSASTNGTISMTVRAIGGNLNLKKLDINNGLGDGTSIEGHLNSNVYGVLVAEVPILINAANDTNYIQLRNVAGIPDRNFGQTSTQGSTNLVGEYHNNIYLPVTTSNGRTWLNNNLGASYSRLYNYNGSANTNFNPAQQATTFNDFLAYGSLYQWGRYSDGHELITYTGSTAGNFINSSTQTKSIGDTPNDNLFIRTNHNNFTVAHDWRSSINDNLWQGENGINNPCPKGYRIPTEDEIIDLLSSETISNNSSAFSSPLVLSATGLRLGNSALLDFAGARSTFWTNEIDGEYVKNGYTDATSAPINQTWRLNGYAVRCIQHIQAPTPIPANMTLDGNKVSYVASINDNDYLPYIAPTAPANQQTSGDGTANDTQIDVQGILSTTGQTISIPFTVTGTVNYDSYSYTVSVHDSLTQDGQGRQVNFSYPAGTASTNGAISMTIKAIDGDLNLKKLDLINGLGNGTSIEGHLNSNVYGVLVAEVPILINDANDTNYVQLRNVSGIPDRRFGETTTQGNPGVAVTAEHHSNLYLPVSAADGKTWLNNNLGANYSRLFNYDGSTNSNFNPAKQATVYNDYNAYGSLYQWGRYSDGHELITYSSSTDGTPVTNSTISSHSTTNTPNNSTFYIGDNTPTSQENNWLDFGPTPNATEDGLWQGESGPNNPCPQGFRLPTKTEFNALLSAEQITTYTNAASSSLKFSAVGHRNFAHGEVIDEGANGLYWLSSIDNFSINFNADFGLLGSGSVNIYSSFRANGFSVRCIQHVEAPTPIPANMTLTGNKVSYIASINDNDYLPYTAPTGPANQQTSGDGSADDTHINIQGTLTTIGQTIFIPFTVTGTVNYDAYSYTVSVHDSLTEDGQGRQVNFSYPAGTASTNGNIPMTIKAIGGNLNLKKLDLNNGLGDGSTTKGHINTNVFGILVAEVPILINDNNDINYIQLRNISGIPDRMFGEASADGGQNEHNFIYLPVTAEDGNVWLNNNLGANYNNLQHGAFNPSQQAQNYFDHHSYGSMFQKFRKADGHELINWTSSNNGTPVNGITGNQFSNNQTNHSLFVAYSGIQNNYFQSWYIPVTEYVNHGWKDESSSNNPCPTGYRLPSVNELSNYWNMFNIALYNSGVDASTHALQFPNLGLRIPDNGNIALSGTVIGETRYSVNDPILPHSDSRYKWAQAVTLTGNSSQSIHATSEAICSGAPIRCIKD